MNIFISKAVPLPISPIPMRSITVLATRDGSPTANPKIVRMYESESDLTLRTSFYLADGKSVTKQFAASAVDRDWLLLGVDDELPKRVSAANIIVSGDTSYTMDFNDGTGSSGGTPAAVSVRIKVEGQQASRQVVAVERGAGNEWRIAGASEIASGALELRVTGGDVYTMAIDNFGVIYQPNLEVAVGYQVRPTMFAGWVYEITDAGQLPSTEPEWWAAMGENPSRPLGTARAIARRYFQPIAHGPVPVEVI